MTLFYFHAVGQVPQGINYQALARNNSGSPIASTELQVKASILSDTLTPVIVWEELHSTVTTNPYGIFSIVIGTGTKQSGSAATFDAIDWGASVLYLKIQINYQGAWKYMGTSRLWSTPYAMVSDKTKSLDDLSKFSIVSSDDNATDALFEVKRKDGQSVFAVYPDAVNIWVPQSGSKGPKGGFSVGGYGVDKAETYDFFRVTPDSVRIYIDPTPDAKGAKGGFAVGGYGEAKGIEDMYFNLTGTSLVSTVKASPQILWYPTKNAFLAGNVHIGSADSVGDYSTALGYQSIAMGDYSQAFGYRAKAFGDYSTSIGKNSIAGSQTPAANNAFAFGDAAKATGSDSYAFGSGALASGLKSFAFGSVGLDDSQVPTTSSTRATGDYSVALGMGAAALNTGAMSVGVGATSSGIASSTFGFYSNASTNFSTAVGYKSTANGAYSIAVGSNATVGPTANYGSAFGRSATANGPNSMAIGYNASTGSTATDASAFGRNAAANGTSSIAVGYGAIASGVSSVAVGTGALAQSDYSYAFGAGATASNTNAYSFGKGSVASGATSLSIGNLSQAKKPNSLAIGNGAISDSVNAVSIGYQSQANGELSIAIGSYYTYTLTKLPYIPSSSSTTGTFITRTPILTPLFRSISFNRANIANGKYSISIGNGNLSDKGGFALGSNNDAKAFGAVAIGVSNKAVNTNTYAAGFNNLATGYYATAFGNNTYSKAYGSFVIGQYNIIAGDSIQWKSTDPLFVVGNGLSTSDRSNAVTVYKNGRSIFTGEHANISLNDKTSFTFFRRLLPPITRTTVFGLKSYVNRADADVDYYYSGYFYDTGSEGTYKGLYADVITSDSIDVDQLTVSFINGAAADVAEYFHDTYSNTEPGDVVVADEQNKESVVKSIKPYQTGIVGVITTRPLMVLGSGIVADDKSRKTVDGGVAAMLALTGRVPVKVTGENGPIMPGDMLTSSSTSGHAMKWTLLDVTEAKDFEEMKSILAENERRRNAIIGKAVESFSGSGTGRIMVLISLQ
jgi:hypothetical protein